ncbi:MAG: trigger factor [Lachnospiraceae bacterium]|nr:trigger factor [Lachnospiraceae bacterium]
MSVKVENLENNMAKLTVTVDADRFDKACDKAYQRQKKSISVPGFRKGKVPRALIEKMYGANVFFEEAADILLNEAYPEAYDESGLDIVSQPQIDIVQIEKGKEFIFTAEVALKPEVKLGKYKGVTVTKIDAKVTKTEVEAEVKRQREQNARTKSVKRAIKDGDTADINFEGFTDGVAFEGGKGENYKLVIGSHSFIDTFEEQLIGKKAGEDVEVNVTFPEQYQAAELAGKPALFKVHVNEVLAKELPKLDDEFVQDVSEYETVDEFKNAISEKLVAAKTENGKKAQEDEAITKIIADSKMDVPDAMVDTQVNRMINDMDQNMRSQGLTIQQYLQFTNSTIDQLKEQVKPDALKRIQSTLVLEAIAEEEKFEVSEEDIDAEIEKIAKQYGMKVADLKKNITDDDKKSITADIKVEKAVDLVMENIKERAKAKKSTTTTKKTTTAKKSTTTTKKTTAKKTTTTKKSTTTKKAAAKKSDEE